MKTVSKKICSIVLALALCMSLCCTAFAASTPPDTGSITISGALANETYTIYQIFDLTYTDYDTEDEDAYPDSYSYKVCEGWTNFLATQTVNVDGIDVALFTLTDGYLDPDSLIFEYANDSAVVAAVARAALAYAEADEDITGISVSYTYDAETGISRLNPQDFNGSITDVTTDENGYVVGDLTFNGLSLGYYLVGTSLGSLCMLDSTDPTAEVDEKNATPTISKWVYNTDDAENEKDDDENNNTQVTYELDVDHITGAVNLVVHDSLPSEIDEDWDNFHPTVTLVDGDTRTALVENTDYVINLTGAGSAVCKDEGFNDEYGCTFEIDFTLDENTGIGYDFSNVSNTAYIEITYTGMLETDGDIYTDDVDEIDNFAVVSFGANSASPVVEAEVYTFGFEILKYTDEYGSDVDIYFDEVQYDFNAGSDAYVISCDDENGDRWYAVFENTTCNENGWQNASFVISEWVVDVEEATHIAEPTDLNVGEESGYYTWEFFYAGIMSEQAEVHVREIETNGDEGITVLDEVDTAVVTFATNGALAGAVFTVQNAEGQYASFKYEDELGVYLFEEWVDEASDDCYVVSADNGMIYIDGLDTGTYTVTETAAPDGYNKLDSSITVEIWAGYNSETGAITEHGVTWTLDNETGNGTVNVLNNSGSKLPSTGGIGTTIFYIIGGILVVGAVVVLVSRRRMTSES